MTDSPQMAHGTAGVALEHDHRVIDAEFERFAAAFADGQVVADAFRGGARGLRHHIYVEEELHFPPLRAAGLFGPILVMLREHGEIWDLLDVIEAQLASGVEAAQLQDATRRLMDALDQHNLKEERILYPAGDAQLPDDIAVQIRAALASGDTPPGWTCHMATPV